MSVHWVSYRRASLVERMIFNREIYHGQDRPEALEEKRQATDYLSEALIWKSKRFIVNFHSHSDLGLVAPRWSIGEISQNEERVSSREGVNKGRNTGNSGAVARDQGKREFQTKKNLHLENILLQKARSSLPMEMEDAGLTLSSGMRSKEMRE